MSIWHKTVQDSDPSGFSPQRSWWWAYAWDCSWIWEHSRNEGSRLHKTSVDAKMYKIGYSSTDGIGMWRKVEANVQLHPRMWLNHSSQWDGSEARASRRSTAGPPTIFALLKMVPSNVSQDWGWENKMRVNSGTPSTGWDSFWVICLRNNYPNYDP